MFCHSPQCQGKAAEKGHVLMVAELGMKTRTENQIILRQAPNIDHGCQLLIHVLKENPKRALCVLPCFIFKCCWCLQPAVA